MTKTREELVEQVIKEARELDVSFIRLWFTDILGQLKSFSITVEELERALIDGMGFDGSSITGYQDIEESDMIAMPDPLTFRILPWRPKEKPVASMFCDIVNPDKTPYEGDPRYVLKKVVQRMKDAGFDHFYVGPELEFFLFKDSSSTEVLDYGSYFDLTTLDAGSDFRRDVIFALEDLGIKVEYSHHEVSPSQHEIDIRYGDVLPMADNVMTYRLVVKEIAQMHGYYATFMPKPIFGVNGSGMHTHESLFIGDRNAFFDTEDKHNLSDVAKKFIAGQLYHAKEMAMVFAQWVNSYKRLVPGFEAPVYIAWSQRNRSALIRVPHYQPGKEKAVRAEFRSPDPACNPYLTFAVLLAAGLEGIEKGYELPDPIDKNLFELTDLERRQMGIESLPGSLGEAISYFEKSELMYRTLGDHVFNRLLELKKKEWDEYRIQVSEWEIKKYLPVL